MYPINWESAPEWAKFIARDSNNLWTWYAYEPRLVRGYYYTIRGQSKSCPVEEVTPLLEKRP